MEESIIRYVHFVGIILLSAMLIAENIHFSKHLKDGVINHLAVIDRFYSLGILITLGAGLFLWFSVGKPVEFYSRNIIFHVKLSLFLLLAILSLMSTIFLLKNYKCKSPSITVPKYLLFIKRIELIFLFILPLLSVLIARGIGNA